MIRLSPHRGGALLLVVLLLAGSHCGGRSALARPDDNDSSGGGDVGASRGGQGGRSSAGSDGDPTGAGGAAGSGGSSACRTEVVLEPSPPVLEFLVDSSLSMKTALTPRASRWAALQQALVNTFLALDAQTLAGLFFYPSVQLGAGIHEGTSWCYLAHAAAAIAPADSTQQQRMLDAVAAKLPLGATPTHDAYLYALTLLSMAPKAGSRHIVLITDGPPTYGRECSGSGLAPIDTAPLQSSVEAARADGVRTFVIALGSEDNEPWLSRLAEAGGTARPGCSPSSLQPCHYYVSGAADPILDLTDALGEVRERAVSCVYDFMDELAPAQLATGAAVLVHTSRAGFSRQLPRFPSRTDCGFGFMQGEPGSKQIELCPLACEGVALGGKISLSRPCQGSR